MGENQDAKAPSSETNNALLPDKNVFRIRVVEHLSWDSYDEIKECFKPGHEDNKPIAGREFKIKMPDGSVITKKTDQDGIIELIKQDEKAKYEVVFEPENAKLNNKYDLFYNRITPVNKKL